MTIEAHLLCWNEKDIMPLVIKHYQSFCDHIVIHDNHSTDGSSELAASLGCEVVPFGNQWFDDQENMNVKNNCWKESKADWVIVADFDEVLCDVKRRASTWDNGSLSHERVNIAFEKFNSTIIKTYGWQVMNDQMPKNDLLEITNGYHFANYSKSIIFNPQAITDMNYNPGAHKCDPQGDVRWSSEELYLLHYKHIGGVQRTIDRYKQYQKRMSPNNRKNGWGIHYNRTPASLRQEWDERMKISKPLL